ncbi:MAG TPA: hypothetical protein VI386_06920 [Candidatus Sulfotelmatobacter sp.]
MNGLLLHYAGKAWATNAITGYKGTTLYFGTLQEFEVFNHATKKSLPAGFEGNVWLSLQKTKGASDLYTEQYLGACHDGRCHEHWLAHAPGS